MPLRESYSALVQPGLHSLNQFCSRNTEGLRKPDKRIYQRTCERLSVAPEETAFLDDIGRNLKPARELGMQTIKVTDPESALAELAELLGFPL